MKRFGNLFEHVVSYENLLLAFRRAMQGCGRTNETCRFFLELEPEILRLRQELIDGTYRPGGYRCFTVYDPKKRIIAVAPFRDRVVHHAIINILTPLYERIFIYDSYATRTGKGTHAAVLRAQSFLRRWPWYLKADIKKYFESIDHDIMIGILERKIKDRRLLGIIELIVRNTPFPGRGLPIGNLTSQFLANVYLDPLDHEIKDQMGVKGYLRYMDDFVIFGNSKSDLLHLKDTVERFIEIRLRLRLKASVTLLNRSTHGLSFLGMRIFPRFVRVKPENRRRSLKRLARKVHAWKKGEFDEERMAQSITSIVGHLRYFCPHVKVTL